MTNLYTNLSEVYEEIYKGFIDYEEEYQFYSKILLSAGCTSVLEIGCGTGNLAVRFAANAFGYSGLDLSEDMLKIAKKNHPAGNFILGDMRDFTLTHKVDAAIVTGRTISYLLPNKDLDDTFKTINGNLAGPGILCFDCIDANKFIPQIKTGKNIIHHGTYNGRDIQRDSFWNINFQHSWTFDWHSVFYEKKDDGSMQPIGEDNSTIRAFTRDEMILFLQLAGFEIQEIIPRPSYAFDTFVVVAKKIKNIIP